MAVERTAADGHRISGMQSNDGSDGAEVQLTFVATARGIHCIAARGYSSQVGTITVRVTSTSPPTEIIVT